SSVISFSTPSSTALRNRRSKSAPHYRAIQSRSQSRTTAKESTPPISPTSSSASIAPILLALAQPAAPASASPSAKPQLKMPAAQSRSPAIQGRELLHNFGSP